MRAAGRPIRVVYANSIQAGNGTAYGSGKEQAGTVLRALEESGSTVVDVRLPNIFGEHGRPWYNSFVATFIHAVVAGEEPPVTDRQVDLLHAQDAAQALIDGLTTDASRLDPVGVPVGVARGARPAPRVPCKLRDGRVPRPVDYVPGAAVQLLPSGALPHPLPDRATAALRRPRDLRRDGAITGRGGSVQRLQHRARRDPW